MKIFTPIFDFYSFFCVMKNGYNMGLWGLGEVKQGDVGGRSPDCSLTDERHY